MERQDLPFVSCHRQRKPRNVKRSRTSQEAVSRFDSRWAAGLSAGNPNSGEGMVEQRVGRSTARFPGSGGIRGLEGGESRKACHTTRCFVEHALLASEGIWWREPSGTK